MRLLRGSRPELISTRPGGRRGTFASHQAALALSVLCCLAAGLAWVGPTIAANPTPARPTATAKPAKSAKPTPAVQPTRVAEPTMSPFVSGRHVYDYGSALSANSAKAAEALAAHIEAAGGGRVVIFTAPDPSVLPDTGTLASAWFVDGMLLDGSGTDYGNLRLGATLKGKLGSEQLSAIGTSPGPQTLESWMMSSLARVDAFLSGTRVFDGAGALDANAKQQAEAAARDLSTKLGAPFYVDISLGGEDPSSAAFFNGADLASTFDNSLVVALGVSGKQIAGYLQTNNSDLWEKYHAVAPWKSTSFSETPAGGDVQAALLAAIGAVQSGSASSSSGPGGLGFEFWFWVIFAIVMVVIGVGSPFYGSWLIRKLAGVKGPIKGGVPGDAVIESIADTGVTVTMPSVGPEAPEYKFGLQVTPAAGGAPYQVETKAFVPRLYLPMIVPGARVGVLIDPADPMKLSIDFNRINAGSPAGGAADSSGGMGFNFDASGQPTAGEVSALVGAVRGGQLPTTSGSADHLLATGTHGTAVITSAQPLGKTVRDINPAADPSRLNDPVWVFTVEVTVAGEKPFPAVFGHRVPLAKLASVVPGVKLAVAVDLSDRNQEVAIDWDRSPIGV